MRFQFYSEALDNVPKLSVDGTVPNSIHFSHWEGNTTPAEVKADTSTEIALNLVASPNYAALTNNIDLVVNNHFDTDGALSCWTVLNGERALQYRELLVSAAESGDFSEHTSDDGVKVSIAIQGADQASPNNIPGSPLAGMIAGELFDDDERAYDLVLPEIERLLSDVNAFEPLWREGWTAVAEALDSFARGDSRVIENEASRTSLITLKPGLSSPFAAISKNARGELFLIATPANNGWLYRLDYPYYSWADTVVRPHIPRRDLTNALATLNEKEPNRDGRWQIDNREMTSAVKFLNGDGTFGISSLEPDDVLTVLSTKHKVQSTRL